MIRVKKDNFVNLPYFPDRIIQWAVMLQIEHIFMEVFTNFHLCINKRSWYS